MATKKKTAAIDTAAQEGNGNNKTSSKNSKSAKGNADAGGKAAAASGADDSNNTKERSQTELVRLLADRVGLPQAKAKEVLEAQAELLVSELQRAGSVQLYGIGKLKVNERGERQGRNPATGEAITIKASKTVKFSGGKKFKDSFNS